MSSEHNLQEIIHRMKQLNLDTSHLVEAQEELQIIERPWLSRLQNGFAKHIRFLKGEIDETMEMVQLLKKGNLTAKEKQTVKTQLLDFAKILPAGFIAATNAVLPIPGTSLFTPLILQKMGLLPTQWNEAHILHLLQQEESNLRSQGLIDLAEQIQKVSDSIHAQSYSRSQNMSLLLHWDANGNGIWDEDEIAAYQKECQRTCEFAKQDPHSNSWYIQQNGLVFGPTTFDRLPKIDAELLVRYQSKTKWVALNDLSDVAHLRSDICLGQQ